MTRKYAQKRVSSRLRMRTKCAAAMAPSAWSWRARTPVTWAERPCEARFHALNSLYEARELDALVERKVGLRARVQFREALRVSGEALVVLAPGLRIGPLPILSSLPECLRPAFSEKRLAGACSDRCQPSLARAQREQALGEAGMGVDEIGRPLERLALPGRQGVGRHELHRFGEPHVGIRRRLGLLERGLPERRPVFFCQVIAEYVHRCQRRCRVRAVGGEHRVPVRLVFIQARKGEAVVAEVRHEPVVELVDRASDARILIAEASVELLPAVADAIDPVAETPVRFREMAELVADDGEQLLGRKRRHQRHAERKNLLVPTENAQTRKLRGARVELLGEHD